MRHPAAYVTLRSLHLFLIAAVMPLGVLGFVQADPASGASRFAIFLVGSLLALFVIAMDQADYPLTALEALQRTGPVVINLVFGFWNGGVLVAAHSSFTSLLASLALSLLLVAVLALRDPELRKQRNLVLGLVLPLALGAGVVAVIVTLPLAQRFVPSVPMLLSALAWIAQTVATTRAWMKQSVFATQSDESRARQKAMGPWNGPSAVAMVAVMIALAGVLLFSSR